MQAHCPVRRSWLHEHCRALREQSSSHTYCAVRNFEGNCCRTEASESIPKFADEPNQQEVLERPEQPIDRSSNDRFADDRLKLKIRP